METNTGRMSPALMWTAAVAIIVFCSAGAAAFMGWLPSSNAARDENVGAIAPAKVTAPKTAAARPPITAAASERQPAARPEPAARPGPVAQARCPECGVIESVRTVEAKGAGSGLGAVGGAVAGGLLGSQVGGGRGQDVMTVVGAVGGAVAGNEVEKRMKATRSYAITVRLEDGTRQVINQASAPTWREGDKVKLMNGAIQANS